MLIDSKNNVPYVYRNSRDMQSLLKLLDLILNAIKAGIDDLLQIFDADTCPEQLLPFLASWVGYDYDIKETIEANRIIIKNYQSIIHNRGSRTGIAMASAISFNAADKQEEVEALDMFKIEYKRSENKIAIYIYYPEYLQKIRELIERARPAGVPLEVIAAYELQTVDRIEIHDYIKNEVKPYDETRYAVGDADVGFSEVTRKSEPRTDPDFAQYDKPEQIADD